MTKYENAMQEFRAVSKFYSTVQQDYRARKVGDDEYLAARALFDAASNRVDEAEAELT